MLRRLTVTAALVIAVSAHAGPKEDLEAAATKLGESGYTWKSVVETRRGEAPRALVTTRDGKLDAEGTLWTTQTIRERKTEAVRKGDKGAVKTSDGWRPAAEVVAGQGEGAEWWAAQAEARMLPGYEPPHVEVGKTLQGAKLGAGADGVLTGEMGEEGIRRLAGPGFGARELSKLEGTAKVWLKEGTLVRVEFAARFTETFGDGFAIAMRKTVTFEFKDVGSTKVEIPAEARKALE